ncbi:MAG: histidine phosphatase family protein [Lachnospiraceae bacterium]|nr:histidine phosphatase family protein [Lachnospiraceae bacterium]
MKLYLLRHGQTDWNVEWRMQGSEDIPLNELGLKQAREAAERMKNNHYDVIFSSPLQRARVTAEIISEALGMDYIIDERLTEMSFGIIEGTTPEYAKENPNRDLFFTDPAKYEPDPTAESFEQVKNRCLSFIDDIKTRDYNDVLIVCHGALTKAMLMAIYNKPVEEFWDSPPQPNCTAIEAEI